MCVLSIKEPIRKSENLSYAPRIYIYIYIWRIVERNNPKFDEFIIKADAERWVCCFLFSFLLLFHQTSIAILTRFLMKLMSWRRLLQPKRLTSTFIINSLNNGLSCVFFPSFFSYCRIYFLIHFYIYIYIYMNQHIHTSRMWHKVIFKVEFNKFEFRVFLLQDWLLYQG